MEVGRLILCRPLLLLPPIPPSIRVFSNESTLRMRRPKYWSFSFSISPSNEHPGLISFRILRLADCPGCRGSQHRTGNEGSIPLCPACWTRPGVEGILVHHQARNMHYEANLDFCPKVIYSCWEGKQPLEHYVQGREYLATVPRGFSCPSHPA